MKSKICPVCGTENELIKKEKKVNIKYASENGIAKIKYYKCRSCGEEFDLDFEKENEKCMKNQLSAIRQKSVSKVLCFLEKDFSFVEFERRFGLPPRTLSKWKTGAKKPSAAAANLVNLIGVFPWLSFVAACDYDLDSSYRIAGLACFRRAQERNNYMFSYSSDNYDILALARKKKKEPVFEYKELLNVTNKIVTEQQYSYN